MEDGLVLLLSASVRVNAETVLILIVVEDGLVRQQIASFLYPLEGLNPYCSGRWSRT